MGCPYFEIQKSEDYENIASIIIADKETKHFVRRRRYTQRCANDDGIRSAFDKKIRHSQSGFFEGLRFFLIVFPLMIAVSICVMVTATPENMTGLIAVPLTALLIGIIWGIFLICHIIEFSFVTSGDRLFIAYDGEGNPYSVEVGEKLIRVLYQNLLHVIKGKRIKKINNERKLYYAYLSMFPQSVLSMEKYVDNSDRSTEPVIIPSINYYDDGRCTLSFREFGYSHTQSLHEGYEQLLQDVQDEKTARYERERQQNLARIRGRNKDFYM